jgi:hypothetical protein
MIQIEQNRVKLLSGDMIGVKTTKHKPILIEDLMGVEYLEIAPNAYGVYIPAEEVLARTKYQWFASLSTDEVLNTTAVVAKYLKASIIDATKVYTKSPSDSTVIRSVIAI